MSSSSYSIEKLHPFRQLVIDGMELASRKHSIHGLVEVDITQARERLRFLITSIIISRCKTHLQTHIDRCLAA